MRGEFLKLVLSSFNEDEKGKVIEEISLTDIFEIIDLYFSVGILRSKTHTYSEKGRTNWSKTVNREFPVFTNDNVPIYFYLHKYFEECICNYGYINVITDTVFIFIFFM